MEIKLFSGTDMFSVRDYLRDKIREEINREKEDYIIRVDEINYIDSMVNKYKIEILSILENEIVADPIRVNVPICHLPNYSRFAYGDCNPNHLVERTRITYIVPIQGDIDYLNYKPTNFQWYFPKVSMDGNNIKLSYIMNNETEEALNDVKARYSYDLKSIKTNIENLNKDITEFNTSLKEFIISIFKTRKESLITSKNLMAKLNVPIIKRDNVVDTFSVSPIKKKRSINIQKPVVDTKAPIEPALSLEIYNEITNTINNVGKEFERHPSIYVGKEEEHLRDHIIMILSNNFESGETTGETFNKNGKTDIMVKYKGNNVFVGECKFWKGKTGFLNTISQLLNYLTWRDSKAAVIMFVENDDFTKVINTATESIKEHPNFVEFIEKKDESWFNYKFNINNDSGKRVYLSLMLYHLPKNYKKD
ncbi:hypothetical protein CYK82_05960 [Clostridium perfringens]|uniref:hypothetical protein n=1 Tax=Clostridium perfringens TaxID=1502 RepID=UPI000D71BB0E|nr:hypothetical protein [Clostridium perfringens]PWX66914.1 hypothetical protein CYK82_05960 [Clostridium perfringens]